MAPAVLVAPVKGVCKCPVQECLILKVPLETL